MATSCKSFRCFVIVALNSSVCRFLGRTLNMVSNCSPKSSSIRRSASSKTLIRIQKYLKQDKYLHCYYWDFIRNDINISLLVYIIWFYIQVIWGSLCCRKTTSENMNICSTNLLNCIKLERKVIVDQLTRNLILRKLNVSQLCKWSASRPGVEITMWGFTWRSMPCCIISKKMTNVHVPTIT